MGVTIALDSYAIVDAKIYLSRYNSRKWEISDLEDYEEAPGNQII